MIQLNILKVCFEQSFFKTRFFYLFYYQGLELIYLNLYSRLQIKQIYDFTYFNSLKLTYPNMRINQIIL